MKDACKALHEAGANTILGTHKDGVILSYKNGLEFEALWGSWKMEGRTGRGDTVTAAYTPLIVTTLLISSRFVAGTLKGMNNQEALDYAAKVPSYFGPNNTHFNRYALLKCNGQGLIGVECCLTTVKSSLLIPYLEAVTCLLETFYVLANNKKSNID